MTKPVRIFWRKYLGRWIIFEKKLRHYTDIDFHLIIVKCTFLQRIARFSFNHIQSLWLGNWNRINSGVVIIMMIRVNWTLVHGPARFYPCITSFNCLNTLRGRYAYFIKWRGWKLTMRIPVCLYSHTVGRYYMEKFIHFWIHLFNKYLTTGSLLVLDTIDNNKQNRYGPNSFGVYNLVGETDINQ